MLVEFEALILEAESAVNLTGCSGRRTGFRSGGKKTQHRMSVVPGRRVLQKFPRRVSDHSEKDRPGQQFGITDLVQLFDGQVEDCIRVAAFEFPDYQPVEIKLRLRVFPGSWIV